MTLSYFDLHHFILVSLLLGSELSFSPLFNARTQNSNLTLGKKNSSFHRKMVSLPFPRLRRVSLSSRSTQVGTAPKGVRVSRRGCGENASDRGFSQWGPVLPGWLSLVFIEHISKIQGENPIHKLPSVGFRPGIWGKLIIMMMMVSRVYRVCAY